MFLYTGVTFFYLVTQILCRPLPGSFEQIEGFKSGRIGNRVQSFPGVVLPVLGSQLVTEHSSISKHDFPSSPKNQFSIFTSPRKNENVNYGCGQLICVSLVFSNTPESEVFRFHFNPAGSNKFLVFNLPVNPGQQSQR